MGKCLRFSDLMRRLAKRCNKSEKTVRQVYDELFELVAEELRFADEVKLKRFGTFKTVQRGGKDKAIPRPDGTLEVKYIEPYQKVKFTPAAEFTNFANGKLVDKESKKRERRGQLTVNERKLVTKKQRSPDADRDIDIAINKILED